MIIYGWGRKTTKDEGVSRTYTCANCRNTNRYRLLTVKTWFTLFFIPVFPYRTQHLEMCPVCRAGRVVSKEELASLKQEALQDQAYLTGAPVQPGSQSSANPGSASSQIRQ